MTHAVLSSAAVLVRLANVAALAAALVSGAAFGASAQSSVQGVPNAMQGFSQNRD